MNLTFRYLLIFLFTSNPLVLFANEYTVETANDADISLLLNLRNAIIQANVNPGPDTILFNITGEGVQTIVLTSALPDITDPLVINGTSQPGYSGVPLIELNGSSLSGDSTYGLILKAGSCEVKGLSIFGFKGSGNNAGISIRSSENKITACFLGVNSSGSSSSGNDIGIEVTLQNSGYNFIGGSTEEEKNVICANLIAGIYINNSINNFITGNYIGVLSNGITPSANNHGILIINSSDIKIGGLNNGEGNIISSNSGNGITVSSGTSIFINLNTIDINEGNGISLNSTNSFLLGNKITKNKLNGVHIQASGNVIGGVVGPFGNIISHNELNGVLITSGMNNGLQYNSIFSNGELGINPGSGIIPNDTLDTDEGPNGLQNYPVLTSVSDDLRFVRGYLESSPNTIFKIEFYANVQCDKTNYGEGAILIGTAIVQTDLNGISDFNAQITGTVLPGQYITATATDPQNNTSAFSKCFPVNISTKKFGEHFVINTTYSGIPLHWRQGSLNYNISSNVPVEFHSAIEAANNQWGNLPQLDLSYSGISNSAKWGGSYDGINNHVWVDSDWSEITDTDTSTIAVTRIRYNALNGEITDADIAYNAESFQWSFDHQPNTMDVQNAVTHEAGHVFGLGDIYNPDDLPYYLPEMGDNNHNESMYGFISENEIIKSDLNQGDIGAINFIYENSNSSTLHILLVIDSSPEFLNIENAFDQMKKSAVELISRLRPEDKIGVLLLPDEFIIPVTNISNDSARADAINKIMNINPGQSGSLGGGLETAHNHLMANGNGHQQSVIFLFSTGRESNPPFAEDVIQSIAAAGTQIFTIGFNSTSMEDQNNLSSISSATDGLYSLSSGAAEIGKIINFYFADLTGLQMLFEETASSDDLIDVPFPGIRWQGAIVDEGSSQILPGIRWQGSEFDLYLETPSGVFITPDSSITNNGIEFFEGTNFKFYKIKNPEAGNWSMFVLAVDVPETEDYTIYMMANSDITFSNSFNEPAYKINDTIIVEGTLFNGGGYQFDIHTTGGTPVTDALVHAAITLPDKTVHIINLDHSGNGVYKTEFYSTNNPGSYVFNLTAVKENFFNRSQSHTVFVSPGDPVSVYDVSPVIKFNLSQNFPNPFNPVTEIHYSIPATNQVRLIVYNVLGQVVKTIVNRRQQAGRYEVLWNGKDDKGTDVSSGIYIYRLDAGNFITNKKMILLR